MGWPVEKKMKIRRWWWWWLGKRRLLVRSLNSGGVIVDDLVQIDRTRGTKKNNIINKRHHHRNHRSIWICVEINIYWYLSPRFIYFFFIELTSSVVCVCPTLSTTPLELFLSVIIIIIIIFPLILFVFSRRKESFVVFVVVFVGSYLLSPSPSLSNSFIIERNSSSLVFSPNSLNNSNSIAKHHD